jgi:succinyl-CoA synthetase beta subunit
MKIHEYQAKELFGEYGIPAPPGKVAHNPTDAVNEGMAMGVPVVLKAQVHVGGRGKAGGIKLVSKAPELTTAAKALFDLTIKDLPVKHVLVTKAVNIAKEVYLSILIDRGARKAVFIGCAEGGIEIEVTAKQTPEKILRLEMPAAKLASGTPALFADFAAKLFPNSDQARQAADIMAKMAKLFAEKDCSLVEINPLITDADGKVWALDAKVILDDNALFRHPELLALRDLEAEDRDELAAKEEGLSFIRLHGNIGCMVNGAGLAMATMDTIKHFGGDPANFLDVGGSSNPKKVVAAFTMILKDPNVKVILINIFGGITRCDDIARGILESLKEFQVPVPIIVRLIGTNEAEGRALLKGTELIGAETLEQGATKAAEVGGRP